MASKKKTDKATAAAERARRDGETDEDYKARIADLDGTEEVEEEDDGLVTVRAISGFTHHTGPTAEELERQKSRITNETDERYDARVAKIDAVAASVPMTIQRGMSLKVAPAEAARLARLGLVLIGDSTEYLGDSGPRVLQEAGLVRVKNG